jgi:hypothetical protein
MGWGWNVDAWAGVQERIVIIILVIVIIKFTKVSFACLERELSRDFSKCETII